MLTTYDLIRNHKHRARSSNTHTTLPANLPDSHSCFLGRGMVKENIVGSQLVLWLNIFGTLQFVYSAAIRIQRIVETQIMRKRDFRRIFGENMCACKLYAVTAVCCEYESRASLHNITTSSATYTVSNPPPLARCNLFACGPWPFGRVRVRLRSTYSPRRLRRTISYIFLCCISAAFLSPSYGRHSRTGRPRRPRHGRDRRTNVCHRKHTGALANGRSNSCSPPRRHRWPRRTRRRHVCAPRFPLQSTVHRRAASAVAFFLTPLVSVFRRRHSRVFSARSRDALLRRSFSRSI